MFENDFMHMQYEPPVKKRGLSDQIKLKPAGSATETSYNIEIFHGAILTTNSK